jgi:hypothetical protein
MLINKNYFFTFLSKDDAVYNILILNQLLRVLIFISVNNIYIFNTTLHSRFCYQVGAEIYEFHIYNKHR